MTSAGNFNNLTFIYADDEWSQLETSSPCGRNNPFWRPVQCGLINGYNNSKTIVIATVDTETKKPCTAAFEWPKRIWTLVDDDDRKHSSENGQFLSFENETRLLYLGEDRSMYVFEGNHWSESKARFPFTKDANDTFIPIEEPLNCAN